MSCTNTRRTVHLSVETIQIGLLLKPLIEQSVRRLSADERASLRNSVIRAQRWMLSLTLGADERLEKALHEFSQVVEFGHTWRVVSAKLRDYGPDSPAAGFVLGLILQVLHEQARNTAA